MSLLIPEPRWYVMPSQQKRPIMMLSWLSVRTVRSVGSFDWLKFVVSRWFTYGASRRVCCANPGAQNLMRDTTDINQYKNAFKHVALPEEV